MKAAICLSVVIPFLRAADVPAECPRACLEALVDKYFAAVVAHDPKQLPLSHDVHFTENGQALDVGDGFWATASGVGSYRHYYADPEGGQVGFMGTVRENGNLALMALRLRVELGKITEIETAFYRKGNGPAWNDAGVDNLEMQAKPEALWLENVPAAQRLTRPQLIAAANSYFAGLEHNDGKGFYPFTDDCHRIENGVATTNNPQLKMGDDQFNPAAMGCKAQFESGFYGVVTRIHHRRFPIIDTERGVVFAFATFDHAGTVPTVRLNTGRDLPMRMFSKPSSILIEEAFKIENGKIRRVEAVGGSVPYHMNPGWGGIDGK